MSFPNIDPYIFRIYGNIGVTWYSLSYVASILIGWKYCAYLIEKTRCKIKKANLDDYINYLIIAIILGGRLGYVFLYEPEKYLANPLDILKTYEGGMSFHGALIGVGLSILLFSYFRKINALELSDLLVQAAPIGFMFGRIANFINGELYGSITSLPWGVVFPRGGSFPRHPSQLYESFLEGFILFIILFYCSFYKKLYKQKGALTGIFLIFYALARIFCEFFRVPEFTYLNLSGGQLYSIPMLIFGMLIFYGTKKSNYSYYSK
ncbi:MAG: prolipoprotein diacylglyceryl transferase [Rickettsiaceae bacterium]|nr:prolipoprotein diacylglyceryl transferase [Rickettsiaceae bacterium]